MNKNDLVKQAQYIFQQSTLVREYIFRQVMNMARENISDKNYKELTWSQYMTLMVIDENGSMTISELAKILRISNPSASAMVEKLVEKGILTREQSQDDRRKVNVRISSTAAKKMAELKQASLGSFIELVKKVGPETAQKWSEVLDEITRVIES